MYNLLETNYAKTWTMMINDDMDLDWNAGSLKNAKNLRYGFYSFLYFNLDDSLWNRDLHSYYSFIILLPLLIHYLLYKQFTSSHNS